MRALLIGLMLALGVSCAGTPSPHGGAVQYAVTHGPPASAVLVDGVCWITSDAPTTFPDNGGADLPQFAAWGLGLYNCWKGRATQSSNPPGTAWITGTVFINMPGDCGSRGPEWVVYGCWKPSGEINIEVDHIGPDSVCPHGTPVDDWTRACWLQFYKVLGHELGHDVYGYFHG